MKLCEACSKQKKMKAAEIRLKFIQYFKSQGHTVVDSSRLIPENDPTLLFTNSGMVQFKNVFLGVDKRPYSRATTAQKCVRAGGKHNDLDNVGHTARHHTFFEMMGNFSFGDYFKKEAIHMAWDLLINQLKFPKEKLYVTVFREDDEAFEIWNKQEKVSADRISRFGEKDNFWQMADTGPCGPCSEIFYDHGPQPNCPDTKNCKVGCSCDRFVEIWNLVFMQFNRDESGKLHPLPKPSVDTGAGLERLAAALQGVPSNYDTDIFLTLTGKIGKLTGHSYEKLSTDPKSELAAAMRVVADHARAAAFLVGDGVIPSNEGQGYVLRRILRRGLRYGRKLSGDKFFVAIVDEVISQFGSFYSELQLRKEFILQAVQDEEDKFLATLDTGTELFNRAIRDSKNIKGKTLSGEVVFKLYDTYGFPTDLTKLMAHEHQLTIDEVGFEKLMKKQKEIAKASGKFGAGAGTGYSGLTQNDLMKFTQDLPATHFLGYENTSTEARVLYFHNDGEHGVLITDVTVFYAEGGGQVGDQGKGYVISGKAIEIRDTKKINDVYVHFFDKVQTSLKVGDTIILEVSQLRRETQRHHSATHLLHSALRKILGEHVNQEGSLVDSQRLRFDFSHPRPLTPEETKKIEALVNEQIARGQVVHAAVKKFKDAVEGGAMALFGEKYGDQVRVLTMGDFSVELCGGTHVHNTSDIRLFKILKESGVSSGVRRIEALAGDAAVKYLQHRDEELSKIESALKASEATGALEKYSKLQEQVKKLERDLKNSFNQSQALNTDELAKNPKIIKGVPVVSRVVEISDRERLSELSDKIKDKLKSGIVILIGSTADDSSACPIVVSVTKDLSEKFHAGQILKQTAAVMGGKGGGRADFAQGSGPEFQKAAEAALKAHEFI